MKKINVNTDLQLSIHIRYKQLQVNFKKELIEKAKYLVFQRLSFDVDDLMSAGQNRIINNTNTIFYEKLKS